MILFICNIIYRRNTNLCNKILSTSNYNLKITINLEKKYVRILQISGLLETYMVINFKAREITRGAYKQT
jgi:hypothetical protein